MDWKKFIAEACILFTVLCVLILLINWIIAGTMEGFAVEPVWFFRVLLVSFVASLARRIRKIEKLPNWARLVIHALLIILGIFFILILPFSISRHYAVSTTLVLLLVLTMVYAALYAISRLFVHFSKKGADLKQQSRDRSDKKKSEKKNTDMPAYERQFRK